MMIKHSILLSLMLLISFSSLAACTQAEYRQFDFWIGKWQVTSYANNQKRISHNEIRKISNGCALLEQYHTPTGYAGKSLNIYDQSRNKWHQTWVDSSGLLLTLEGGLQGKNMVMQGETTNAKGQKRLNRITWTPNTDGSVTQQWDISTDNGKTWNVAFKGIYTKLP